MTVEEKDTMIAILEERKVLAKAKAEAEEALKEFDAEAKTFMIQNDIGIGKQNWFKHDGYMMKVAEGENRSIIDKEVRSCLMTLGFDPDQIQWFMDQVTKVTPYDYIDLRKAGAGAGGGKKK